MCVNTALIHSCAICQKHLYIQKGRIYMARLRQRLNGKVISTYLGKKIIYGHTRFNSSEHSYTLIINSSLTLVLLACL